jgi:hypothetical protein
MENIPYCLPCNKQKLIRIVKDTKNGPLQIIKK